MITHMTIRQDRVRLKARWAIAQGPQLSRGPQKGKIVIFIVYSAYENRLSKASLVILFEMENNNQHYHLSRITV